MECYSTIKHQGNTCSKSYNNMKDMKGIILSKISQTEKKILYDLIYMWNLKQTNKQTHQTHRKEDQNGVSQRWWRGNWMKVIKRYKLPVVR